MAETKQTTEIIITKQPETSNNNNNPFFFLTLLPKLLLKPLQMFNKQEKTEKPVKRVVEVAEEEKQSYAKIPDVVRFPVKKESEVQPIILDEEDAPKDSNALIQWQIYALGGFIVMRWAWGKWQEWKAKNAKDSPNEDGEDAPPADDLPPADD